MQKKKVWQYKCDFCGKKNYSAGHMRTHEKHCTMNPKRHCRMCDLNGGQSHLSHDKMLSMIPDPIRVNKKWDVESDVEWSELTNEKEIKEATVLFRQESECPACTLAVLRQKGIHPNSEADYDYQKDCQGYFKDYNDTKESMEFY